MTNTNSFTTQYCNTMAEVRGHIDALDTRIVALLAERSTYVAQAARIKNNPDLIVDEQRIAQIIARVRQMAASHSAPEDVAELTFRAMIGAFIEFERAEFTRLHTGSTL